VANDVNASDTGTPSGDWMSQEHCKLSA